MSFLKSAQVVDAVIAKMEWPDHLNRKFRSIPGPPNGVRLAGWDLQDALDWMDSDLGDEKETKRAAVYMVGDPMSFEDNLQLALGRRPAASEPELPRELHLGEYAWTNGKVEIPRKTRGFRKLRADELRELKRRLQAVFRRDPQHHVILLNLMGHDMDDGMMQELAGPIAALKALQVLVLSSKSRPHLCSVYFFMATSAFSLHFYTLQTTASARLVA
jgi:hypothetical protein